MRSEYSMDDSPIFTILGSLTVVIHHYRTHTHTHAYTTNAIFTIGFTQKPPHIPNTFEKISLQNS